MEKPSRFRSTGIVCVAIFAASTVVPQLVFGQQDRRNPGDSREPSAEVAEIMAAEQLLYVAYPELLTRPVAIDIKRSGDEVLVSVADASTTGERIVAPTALLDVAIQFNGSRELMTLRASGPHVEAARNKLLVETLLQNPGWTDSDVEVWLSQARGGDQVEGGGATHRGGADARWQRLIGTDITRENPTARFRRNVPGSSTPFTTTPGWSVAVHARRADGSSAQYRFDYEPFSGRLIAVTRE